MNRKGRYNVPKSQRNVALKRVQNSVGTFRKMDESKMQEQARSRFASILVSNVLARTCNLKFRVFVFVVLASETTDSFAMFKKSDCSSVTLRLQIRIANYFFNFLPIDQFRWRMQISSLSYFGKLLYNRCCITILRRYNVTSHKLYVSLRSMLFNIFEFKYVF